MTSRLAFLSLAASLLAAAHELDVTARLAAPAVIVQASYAGTEPVPFARIQIYSPANPGREFQAGNLDQRGYFGFVPDAPGAWRVVVDDELGHKRELTVQVPDPFQATTTPGGVGGTSSGGGDAGNRLERALLGLAILFGATGFWYGYKVRKQTR